MVHIHIYTGCRLPVTSIHTHSNLSQKRFIFTFASHLNGSKRITEKLSTVQLLIFAITCAITLKICSVLSHNNVSIWENQIRQISFETPRTPKMLMGGWKSIFDKELLFVLHICNLRQWNGLIESRKPNRTEIGQSFWWLFNMTLQYACTFEGRSIGIKKRRAKKNRRKHWKGLMDDQLQMTHRYEVARLSVKQ